MAGEAWRYVLYVDEAGDDGIKRLPQEAERPPTDWFVVGGLLLPRSDDNKMVAAVRRLMERLRMSPGAILHFVAANDRKRLEVCREITKLRCRWFCVASHKDNMRGFKNRAAQSVSNKENPMYNFLLRVMLERVTEYCVLHNAKLGLPNNPSDLKVLLSQRGGLSATDLGTYLARLWTQERRGGLYLRAKLVDFAVFSPETIEIRPNADLFGLQLADAVASSLLKALPSAGGKLPKPEFIKALAPSGAVKDDRLENCGLTILPWRWRQFLPPDVAPDVRMFLADMEREVTGARLRDPTGSV